MRDLYHILLLLLPWPISYVLHVSYSFSSNFQENWFPHVSHCFIHSTVIITKKVVVYMSHCIILSIVIFTKKGDTCICFILSSHFYQQSGLVHVFVLFFLLSFFRLSFTCISLFYFFYSHFHQESLFSPCILLLHFFLVIFTKKVVLNNVSYCFIFFCQESGSDHCIFSSHFCQESCLIHLSVLFFLLSFSSRKLSCVCFIFYSKFYQESCLVYVSLLYFFLQSLSW